MCRDSIAGHWDYEQRLRDTVLAEDACLQKDSTARKEAREKLASSGKQNEVRIALDHAECPRLMSFRWQGTDVLCKSVIVYSR